MGVEERVEVEGGDWGGEEGWVGNGRGRVRVLLLRDMARWERFWVRWAK